MQLLQETNIILSVYPIEGGRLSKLDTQIQ